jgi:hypothetical protein
MNVDRIIYLVREKTGSISDDRWVSDRLILEYVGMARATFIRNLVSRKAYFNTTGLSQVYEVNVETVSRSVMPTCPMYCEIMRSTDKIPKLVYEGTLGNWYDVKPVDVIGKPFELIEPEKAACVTFEFNVVYTFLYSDYYLYFLSKDNLELKCAIVSGIFEDPLEVDPDLTDYPMNKDIWDGIFDDVVANVMKRIPEDPVNNSEPDLGEQDDRQRAIQETQRRG